MNEDNKKEDEDLKIGIQKLQSSLNQRYVPESNSSALFWFLLISLGLIIYGGIAKNVYSIVSGTILIIFLAIILKNE